MTVFFKSFFKNCFTLPKGKRKSPPIEFKDPYRKDFFI